MLETPKALPTSFADNTQDSLVPWRGPLSVRHSRHRPSPLPPPPPRRLRWSKSSLLLLPSQPPSRKRGPRLLLPSTCLPSSSACRRQWFLTPPSCHVLPRRPRRAL